MILHSYFSKLKMTTSPNAIIRYFIKDIFSPRRLRSKFYSVHFLNSCAVLLRLIFAKCLPVIFFFNIKKTKASVQ